MLNPRASTELSLLKETTTLHNAPLERPVDIPPLFESTTVLLNETKGTANATATSAYDMSEMRGKLRADLLVPRPKAVVRIEGIIPSA